MKLSKLGICRYISLFVVVITTNAIATPSVLAEPVQIQPETIPIIPERLRERIIIPNNRICGARTKAECEAWLRRIREAQEVRGIKNPQPLPDPSPELIRVSPHQINPQLGR